MSKAGSLFNSLSGQEVLGNVDSLLFKETNRWMVLALSYLSLFIEMAIFLSLGMCFIDGGITHIKS